MVFWLAVLVGALFAWIAVRIGFYASWIIFFHLLLAAYVAIFVTPVVIGSVPPANAAPGYGYALTLMSIAIATLLVTYGTCYACLSGKMRLELPRGLDTIGAGFLGFFTGFLVWSFLGFAFCLTPLANTELVKRLGFDAASQKANTAYMCWWCNGFHALVVTLGDETTSQQEVAMLVQNATAPEAKQAAPEAPVAPPAPPPPPLAPKPNATPSPTPKPTPNPTPNPAPNPAPTTAAGPGVTPAPPPAPKSVAGPPQTENLSQKPSVSQPPSAVRRGSAPPAAAAPPGDPLDEELSRRQVIVYSPDAVPAATANRGIRIIEVANVCTADRFNPHQTSLLQDWVSKGGILWVNNNVLTFFGLRYAKLGPADNKLDCTVSKAVEVTPIVDGSEKVTLGNSGGRVHILAAKGVIPLLALEEESPSQQKAGTACWSVVPYGKGWISDPQPVDTTKHDGAKFWRNFCRFCLGREPAAAALTGPSPPGSQKPPAAPQGPLCGTWQASNGARFRIDDDGKTLTIDLLASEALQSLTGRLVRRDEPADSLTGILDAVFKADPSKRYAIDATATIADTRHLRLRCTNWPKWKKQGTYPTKTLFSDIWLRSDTVLTTPVHPDKPFTTPSW
jgi:hypothetical protein